MTGKKGFVIDASVAIKWIIEEEDSDKADLLRGADMVAPALLRIEAGSVLRAIAGRKAVSDRHALELFLFLQTAPVTIVDPDEVLERRAMELALELQQSVYDCVYLALAERMDRHLITADRQLLRGLADTEYAARTIDLAALDLAPAA
ncbi:hypothetical protein SAMN05444413_1129 [Roseivivax marinus]|uniref:type II toxin-antitoxin system VapC family toxin n=1 Tax=Roseivivax marinus TaxID=1379903 RepID=UPI0008B1D2BD|nr:type II toxin-antitoxin system VapC family toxin [Roseivivax marinus]SEL61761.1 hypothetical protein SAMN05444413_1129 [Roseivivax marinus]